MPLRLLPAPGHTASGPAAGHHDAELAALLHRDERVTHAERRVQMMIADLLADASGAGFVRDDIAVNELAAYCLHALAAARRLPSVAAVGRLVDVTLAGLRPRR